MKNRVIILYLALATISSTESQPCRQGNITLSEANERDIKVGRVYICTGSSWRAVCGDNWDLNAARVVCTQLRFPPQGAQVYSSAINSDTLLEAVSPLANINFHCVGNESLLSQCPRIPSTECTNYAGVICVMPCQEPSPPECPGITTITTTPSITACNCMTAQASTAVPVSLSAKNATDSTGCTTERAVMLTTVGISAILLLTLLGVAIGWVWFCHRKQIKTSRASGNMQRNPAYMRTTPTQISTNYSSIGPQDMPSGHATAQTQEVRVSFEQKEEERRIYHVLEQPGRRKEGENDKEGVYHMIEEVGDKEEGMEYEVPIQTKSKERDENSEREKEMEYSTLHHN